MKHERPWMVKAFLRKKEQCWRYHNTWLQTMLQSHSNKNNLALVQKQTWRPVEQNRSSRLKPLQLQSVWFLTKEPKTCIGEKITFSTNDAEKTWYPPVEDWN
jgi:hypothetical protein